MKRIPDEKQTPKEERANAAGEYGNRKAAPAETTEVAA